MKTRIVWIMAVLLLVIVTPLQAQTKQKGYTKTKGRLGANGVVVKWYAIGKCVSYSSS